MNLWSLVNPILYKVVDEIRIELQRENQKEVQKLDGNASYFRV